LYTLGDDPLRATTLGLANIRRLAPLVTETAAHAPSRPDDPRPDGTQALFERLILTSEREMAHVVGLVGGRVQERRPPEDGVTFSHVPAARQGQAEARGDCRKATLAEVRQAGTCHRGEMRKLSPSEWATVGELVNTAAIQGSTENPLFERHADLANQVMQDPSLAAIPVEMRSDQPELSEVDWVRWEKYQLTLLDIWALGYNRHQRSLLATDHLGACGGGALPRLAGGLPASPYMLIV
jgi:hypothetical protein